MPLTRTQAAQDESFAKHGGNHYMRMIEAYAFAASLEAELSALQETVIEIEGRKDAAYLERNRLVALLSKLFPAGKKRTAIEGWSEDWHGCVYIDLPTGQASWHYHDSQAYLFDHLPEYQGEWDGHTTEEKYGRIASVVSGRDI